MHAKLEACLSERGRVATCFAAVVGGRHAGRLSMSPLKKNSGLRETKLLNIDASRIWLCMWMLGGPGGRLTWPKFEKVEVQAIGSKLILSPTLRRRGRGPHVGLFPEKVHQRRGAGRRPLLNPSSDYFASQTRTVQTIHVEATGAEET